MCRRYDAGVLVSWRLLCLRPPTVLQDLLGTCKEEEVKSLARQYICLNDLSIESVAQKLGLRANLLHGWMESGAGTPEKPATSNVELMEKVKRWLRLQGAAINSGSASKEGGPHLRAVSSVTAIADNIAQLPSEATKNDAKAPNESQAAAPNVPQLDHLTKVSDARLWLALLRKCCNCC